MDNSTTTLSYTHKQLDQRPESNTDSLTYQEKQSAKRRQTKELFRPWLDKASPPTACPPESTAPALGPTFRPTLAETPRQRKPREHQRRDRSLLASLLSRRAEQAQAQYIELMAELEQQAHTNLYYRQLLPRQHQQFLKQIALDQQMLANGAQQ